VSASWQWVILANSALIVALGVVVTGISRQTGAVLLQLHPPEPASLPGGPHPGNTLLVPEQADEAVLVVFVSSTCALCGFLENAVPSASRHIPAVTFRVAVAGPVEARAEYAARFGEFGRPEWGVLYDDWKVPGTPYAVGLTSDQRVFRVGIVNNVDQLEALASGLAGAEAELGAGSVASPLAEESSVRDTVA
jgi:hypothetical protein